MAIKNVWINKGCIACGLSEGWQKRRCARPLCPGDASNSKKFCGCAVQRANSDKA